jgi:tRNA threonylcarbamoyl adenosine modification protein (Sua5/YciO/YrdC/YwlC family)
MKRIDIDRPEAAAVLANTLAGDGVAVAPTDTMYGLSAALSSGSGYRRIVSIKRCEPGRRFLYLASSVDMVRAHIASWGCGSREHLAAVWPAPITGIFRIREGGPGWIGDTIAFRVPALGLIRDAVDILAEPIVSTSVNIAGETPLNDIEQITDRVGDRVDLIVGAGKRLGGRPSTIVDFTGPRPVVIREGAYDWPGGGNPSN